MWRVLSNAEHTGKGSRAVRNETEKGKERKGRKKKEERKGANEVGKPAQTYIFIIILFISRTLDKLKLVQSVR